MSEQVMLAIVAAVVTLATLGSAGWSAYVAFRSRELVLRTAQLAAANAERLAQIAADAEDRKRRLDLVVSGVIGLEGTVEELHKSTNSRLDQLLNLTGRSEYARGQLEGPEGRYGPTNEEINGMATLELPGPSTDNPAA